VDTLGLTRYCYISGDGAEAPTLRVKPGDEVVLDLRNELGPVPAQMPSGHIHRNKSCSAASPMTSLTTNLHFHGLAIPPLCHQDDVIHTSIQPSQPAFQYRFKIPADHPPGLYWYHPHPHGYSEGQVLGGASGALIVEGIERRKPQVAGLPERILILRDQLNPVGNGVRRNTVNDPDDATGKDLSLNFVPVTYPLYMPAVIRVNSEQREFWRVLNAAADTYFKLQLVSVDNGRRVPRHLQLIAVDGVPAAAEATTELLLSPGARAEFVVTTPQAGAFAQLVSSSYDTGPDGAANPRRVIANIIATANPEPRATRSQSSLSDPPFTGLAGPHPTRVRKLFFSEDREDLKTPGKPAKYYITVDGKTPAPFDMNFKKPDINVRQGTIEDWIIENRARESHVFHIHQLHFQLVGRDGVEVSEAMLRDTIDLPYWDGKSDYPSVRLRMDFRSPEIVGTFLFHCHILEHEDGGMMGSVRVLKSR
jgi:FtsP/CotA-like multicopper oxidase with cupredoxin domain